ncbi:NAD kinase [Streptomonospora nanhaiensis]|uniref:NAD kinase n=1 Tax=Streptomonospora nanhaiensis TaxID=1323731 RepID=A0A853BWM0_9ACTN|nr:NAD kinase [Streptomonospora nanhaiensis]MBV2365690.1 NAD kinase [Streptomonospora nanhaiensis]MBX9390670.1 NAD kinase [Streptomonospora nanhaiensis]NYI98871.1 NAD+ kinase [Streptomonospora nanhaiensis]
MTSPGQDGRSVLLLVHTGRPAATRSAQLVHRNLTEAGLTVRMLASEVDELKLAGCHLDPVEAVGGVDAAAGVELVLVLGGDGTLLRAAEIARPAGAPLLGVNLGHVGFLAEAEREDLTSTVRSVVDRAYEVEERMTLDVAVFNGGRHGTAPPVRTWALNEATLEKANSRRMLDMVLEIDDRPLSRWGCDGVVCATPTGSTAHAFSAGGPIVWPEVEALVVVPISAHALFARPIVVSPESTVAFEIVPDTTAGVLWCDGRRMVELPAGARIEVTRSDVPVRLARLQRAPFTDRLVAKFALPVAGWRGRAERDL